MKQEEANRLIKGAFGSSYDEGRLNQLIKNLISDEKPLNERSFSGQYIKDSFKGHINSYKRLMKFEDSDRRTIDVLAVEVATPHALENARTMQRNFIATYLNGSRGGKLKDAALVAFYCKDSPDWRFSLVKMDYVLDKEQNKVRKELTPARRYSFLVGKNEGTHTACKQLAAILTSDKDTTLDMLEQAFSIETVTKEFFNEYKGLYEKLKAEIEQHIKKDKITNAEFEKKGVVLADFAKRLLGQLVFLYFLQKKGWLGVKKGEAWGTGSKDFLRELYENGDYNNFFNDKLEPLFYEALATERKHTDNFYDPLKCRIPFLNGGLFEPISNYDWKNTDILLGNKIFGEIFDVFKLYNFTVREDEPLDKEVAVDPEMLGRVFENLIPENERKGSGTYYTPREIVHYMCQESLINYLDSKLELHREDIEVFIHGGDIAKENDATALEKQQKENYSGDYKLKLPASIHANAQAIDKALADVKICDPAIGSGAFPVGLMTEIVRARGLLNVKLGKDRRDYDFKRHAIQESIYGVDIEASAVDIAKLRLWLSLVVDEEDFKNIQPLPNLDYKIVCGNSLLGVESLLNAKGADMFDDMDSIELTKLKGLFVNETSRKKKDDYRKKIEKLTIRLREGEHDFKIYFDEVFRENKGFDIVIANPPYVSYGLRGVGKMEKEYKTHIRNKFLNSAEYKISMYALFMNICIEICAPKGVQTLIVPDSFLLGRYFSKIRNYILSLCEIRFILLLTYKVFNATVGFPTIYCIQKQKTSKGNKLLSLTANSSDEVVKRDFEGIMLEQSYYNGVKHKRFRLFFKDSHRDLVIKIEKDNREIGDFFRGRTGVRSLIGQKNIISKEASLVTYKKGLISGGQIKRYFIGYEGDFINIDPSLLNKGGWDKSVIENSKLLVRQTADSIIAALDVNHYYHLNNIHSFAPKDNQIGLKVLLAIFNSQLMDFFYRTTTLETGRAMAQTDIETLESLPIAEPDEPTRRKIETLVDKIHAAKKSNPSADVSALETHIDTLIYQLYNLTSEEVALIQNSTSQK